MEFFQLRSDLKNELNSVYYKDFSLLTELYLLFTCAVLYALLSSKLLKCLLYAIDNSLFQTLTKIKDTCKKTVTNESVLSNAFVDKCY